MKALRAGEPRRESVSILRLFRFQERTSKMIVRYRRNRNIAYYDSESLAAVGRPEPPDLLRRPFISCGKCPYPSHGFQCYNAEGDCLKTHLEKVESRRKTVKT